MIHITNVITKGIEAELMQAVGEVPTTYPQWTQRLGLTALNTTYPWLGDLPSPRLMVNGRLLQNFRGFDLTVTSQTHELSAIVPLSLMEEDQLNNAVAERVRGLGLAWGTYMEQLAVTVLINGGSLDAWDGNTLYHDTREVGDSGAIDNDLTAAASGLTGTDPTSAEFINSMSTCKAAFVRFKSDKGKPTVNAMDAIQLLVIAPPTYEGAIKEALAATQISATDNVVGRGIATGILSPFITADDIMYVIANGGTRKPVLFGDFVPMATVIHGSAEAMDTNDGLKVTLRGRFTFVPGDFYKVIRFTWT